MKNKFILLLFLSFCTIQSVAQKPCAPSKNYQSILENSQLFNQEYISKTSFCRCSEDYFIKKEDKSENIKINVCDLKIENDSLTIEGFINTKKNFIESQIYFFTGNKVETFYDEKFTSCVIDETFILGTYDAFYLKNKEEEVIDAFGYENYIFPKRTYFNFKLNIKEKSLFVITAYDFYTEIFDLNKLKESLTQLAF